MKKILILLVIGFNVLLSQSAFCDVPANSQVSAQGVRQAEEYLEKLRQGDFAYLQSVLGAELVGKVDSAKLSRLSSFFRKGEPLSTELIASKVHDAKGVWLGFFSFEYHFSNGWNIANIELRKRDAKMELIGVSVFQTPANHKEISKFALSNKSVYHYLILILAVIVPIMILITLYYCIKTPISTKLKWLWVIFILGGLGSVSINWLTGAVTMKIVHYQILGAGVVKGSPYAPWVISVGFPLGALVFWLSRNKLLARANRKG